MQTPVEPIYHAILVIEEDDAILTFLADQSTADEYTIHEIADLDRALALCVTRRPDAAITDVSSGSGREFAARVRGGTDRGVDARLPLILLGTAPGELDAVRAFDERPPSTAGRALRQ